MEKLSEGFFDSSMNSREHAIFEVGIKLAAIYHIMIGIPVTNEINIKKKIADGIIAAISCQPFVKKVEIGIKDTLGQLGQKFDKEHEFDYTYVSGKNLFAKVEVKYDNWIAVGYVEWVSDLNYPLMYIKELREDPETEQKTNTECP